MASLTLRGPEVSAIVIDYEAKIINLVTPEGTAAASAVTIDADGNASSSGGDPGFEVDAYKQPLPRIPPLPARRSRAAAGRMAGGGAGADFSWRWRSRTRPSPSAKSRIPTWFSATQGMLNDSGIGGTAPQEDRDFNAALAKRALLSMKELFAVGERLGHGAQPARQHVGEAELRLRALGTLRRRRQTSDHVYHLHPPARQGAGLRSALQGMLQAKLQ